MSHPAALRTATIADLPTILDLLATLDSAGTPPMDLAQAEVVFTRMQVYPSYRIWLVEAGREILGTYSLMIMDNLGHRGAPEAIVENVAVVAAARGRGIGRLMMEHAMAEARAAGCYKLVLSSNAARTEAHAFYDALGFERHGISFRVDFPAQVQKAAAPV